MTLRPSSNEHRATRCDGASMRSAAAAITGARGEEGTSASVSRRYAMYGCLADSMRQ